MDEENIRGNIECRYYPSEDDTIKNCSNIEIETTFKEPIGSGTFGIVYPIVVKFGTDKVTMILKKISKTITNEKEKKYFIEDMHDEVDYSYEMGKNNIGPRVYDAFFYQTEDTVNQFIIMEKFDTSVANWILSGDSDLNKTNCSNVSNKMLDLLYKQIFKLNMFCGDIKPDNFVINLDTFTVRMIDFGIEWCSNLELPKAYFKLSTIKHHSLNTKKKIFYCLCTLQLFMNIINIGTPPNVIKMLIKPFYKDDIFIEYILQDELKGILKFDDVSVVPGRKKRRSRDHLSGKGTKFKSIFKEMLDYGTDQAILLAHYTYPSKKKETTSDEIVDFVFNKIRDLSTIF